MYACTHTHARACACTHTCICMCVRECVHVHACVCSTHTHTHTHTRTHTHTHTHTHTDMPYTYAFYVSPAIRSSSAAPARARDPPQIAPAYDTLPSPHVAQLYADPQAQARTLHTVPAIDLPSPDRGLVPLAPTSPAARGAGMRVRPAAVRGARGGARAPRGTRVGAAGCVVGRVMFRVSVSL